MAVNLETSTETSPWKGRIIAIVAIIVIVGVVGYITVGAKLADAMKKKKFEHSVTGAAVQRIEGLGGQVDFAFNSNMIVRVTFNDTDVTDDDLVHLRELDNLPGLDLSETQISDAGLVHLKDLGFLRVLDLSQTPITDAGLAHLAPLTQLRQLTLDYTAITDEGLQHLAVLSNLHVLNLTETKVTPEGVAGLKRKLGSLEVAGIEPLEEAVDDMEEIIEEDEIIEDDPFGIN